MKNRIPRGRRAAKQAAEPAAQAKPKARPDWASKFFPDDDFEYQSPEMVNELHVDRAIIDDLAREGLVLQWNTSEVYGRPEVRMMGQAQAAGWVAVQRGDLGGKLDHLLPADSAEGDNILVGGLQLMCRPLAIHEKARARDRRASAEPIEASRQMLVEGVDVPGGGHPSATRQNRINRTVERIEIPGGD
ncbi:MAG TPA: hypothetical protein VIY51_20715 [Xanthobacteraceae bacterium]